MSEPNEVPSPRNILDCNSLVFMDLETSGLPAQHPPRITEISFYGIHKQDFIKGKFKEIPRVLNRLNLCVYPSRLIDPGASEVTKLDNYNLEPQSMFDENVYETINGFLKRLKGPVCLVAHNGIKFDFPILVAEVAKLGKVLPEDMWCADSLHIFKYLHDKQVSATQTELSLNNLENQMIGFGTPTKGNYIHPLQRLNETTPQKRKLNCDDPKTPHSARKSFKLGDIFESYHGQKPRVAHTAEADVMTLLLSAIAANPEEFLDSLNVHAVPLTQIKKCW